MCEGWLNCDTQVLEAKSQPDFPGWPWGDGNWVWQQKSQLLDRFRVGEPLTPWVQATKGLLWLFPAVTSMTNSWPAHVFHAQAAEQRLFRAAVSNAPAVGTHLGPWLLHPFSNREEKAPETESNYNELFAASHRRFILCLYKVKRKIHHGGSHSSWQQKQVPAPGLRFWSPTACSGLCSL